MALATIYVKDSMIEYDRPLVCFTDNMYGYFPTSVNITHIANFPVAMTLTINQGEISAVSSEHNCYGESYINGLISVVINDAAPPEYIDFFIRSRDNYETINDIVVPIGRSVLMDTPFNSGANRVYTSLIFSLPVLECNGMNVDPFISVGAKLPAAWAPAQPLVVSVSLLGLPNTMAP